MKNTIFQKLIDKIPVFFVLSVLIIIAYLYGWMAGRIGGITLFFNQLKVCNEYIKEIEENLRKAGWNDLTFSEKRSRILTKPKIIDVSYEKKQILVEPNFSIDDPFERYLVKEVTVVITPETKIVKYIKENEETTEKEVSFEEINKNTSLKFIIAKETVINKNKITAEKIIIK